MMAIAGGILLAAMLLGAGYVALSLIQIDAGVGWTALAVVVGIAAWVIF